MKKCIIIVLILIVSFSVFAQGNKIKAFKDVYFKESAETVKDKLKDYDDIEEVEQYIDNVIYAKYSILYNEYDLEFSFFNDQLYKIWLYGGSRYHNKFNWETKEDIDLFKNIFIKAYGEPQKTNNITLTELRDINEVKNIWLYEWKIKNEKEIKLGIQINGNKHNVQFYINYLPLLTKRQEKRQQQRRKAILKASKDF